MMKDNVPHFPKFSILLGQTTRKRVKESQRKGEVVSKVEVKIEVEGQVVNVPG